MDPAIAAQLAGFREARRELEASVLPLATSVDGRRFSFQASLYGLQVQIGGYVVLEDGDATRLGQVITLDLDQLSTELMLPAPADGVPGNRSQVLIRYAHGEGVILEGDFAPFHDVTVRPATGAEVRAWLGRTAAPGAKLQLGELALASGVPCAADAGGFNRHTFLCGQSGSGKTYSLGVILERLLTETGLRMVILDPNSDFVRLGNGTGRRRSDAGRALPGRGARCHFLRRPHAAGPGLPSSVTWWAAPPSWQPRGSAAGPDSGLFSTGPRGTGSAGMCPGLGRSRWL
jgi:uncharacterized protein